MTIFATKATFALRYINAAATWTLDTAEARAKCAKDAVESGSYYGPIRDDAERIEAWGVMLDEQIDAIALYRTEQDALAHIARVS